MKKIPKNEAKIDQKTQFLAFYRVSAIGRTGRIFGRIISADFGRIFGRIFGIGRILICFKL